MSPVFTSLPILAAALMSLYATAPARAGDAEEVARLDGSWVYAGDDDQRLARMDAIEATVQQMPALMRSFARKRIDRSTQIPETYVIDVDGELISIGKRGETGLETRWDGTASDIPGDESHRATLTRTFDGGKLRSHVQEPKGSGTDLFALSADGQTLTVTVTIASKHLPSDIVYDLTFRRE